MKGLTKILNKDTLSGKDRALLLIYSSIEKEKNGKAILEEHDITAIRSFNDIKIKGPDGKLNYFKRNRVIDEFNLYIENMNSFQEVRAQIKVIYLDLQNRINKVGRVIDHFVWKENPDFKNIDKYILEEEGVLDLILDNTYIVYEDLINEIDDKEKKAIEELIKNQEIEIVNNKDGISLITGRSIYNLKSEHEFKKDYLNEIDKLKDFFKIIWFIKERKIEEDYSNFLKFKNIMEKASEFFEIELDGEIKEYIEELEDDFRSMNISLLYIFEKSIKNCVSLSIPLEIDFDKILLRNNIETEDSKIYLKALDLLKDIFID